MMSMAAERYRSEETQTIDVPPRVIWQLGGL
jgi:hypothetical protein